MFFAIVFHVSQLSPFYSFLSFFFAGLHFDDKLESKQVCSSCSSVSGVSASVWSDALSESLHVDPRHASLPVWTDFIYINDFICI